MSGDRSPLSQEWAVEHPMAVVRLADDQIERAGALLARAFVDDPLAVSMSPSVAARASGLPQHFSATVRYAHLFGEVHVTPEPLAGVAIWLPPGAGDMTEDRIRQVGLDRATDLLGMGAWERFVAVVDHIDRHVHRAAPGPCWSLLAIGVEPARQGQGIASALLRAGHERAAADGAITALWTVQPTNVAFYQRRGYRIVAAGVEPTSGLRFWAFTRPSGV